MATEEPPQLIEELVQAYEAARPLVANFQDNLMSVLVGSPALSRHVHSVKSRLKTSERLRDKIRRKIADAAARGTPLDITPSNLLTTITDLGGVRILHLYTRQIRDIDAALREILAEQRYALVEGPVARTWDDEYRAFFKTCGIETQDSPTLYTSVHYVVSSASRTTVTCEIQVRTLMEEVWGEVDHSINYPYESDSLACREQLKVLARVTSSATRLVDSIFLSLEDHRSTTGKTPDDEAGAR